MDDTDIYAGNIYNKISVEEGDSSIQNSDVADTDLSSDFSKASVNNTLEVNAGYPNLQPLNRINNKSNSAKVKQHKQVNKNSEFDEVNEGIFPLYSIFIILKMRKMTHLR